MAKGRRWGRRRTSKRGSCSRKVYQRRENGGFIWGGSISWRPRGVVSLTHRKWAWGGAPLGLPNVSAKQPLCVVDFCNRPFPHIQREAACKGRVRMAPKGAKRKSEPRLDSSTAILDSSRQLLDSSTASTAAVKLSSRQLLDSFSTARQRATFRTCQGCQAVNSTARQLDSSTARQLRLGLPCMNWPLHLIWFALSEVHPSRKVSLDKCSHQGVAHWHQCTLHDAPS